MTRGHVSGFGGHPGTPGTDVRGHRLGPEVERDQGIAGVQFEALAHVLVRYRVMMLLILHVVIDIDLDRLDIDITVRMPRQGLEGRFVELLERLLAITGQLLERFLIEILEQDTDTLIQLSQ